MTSKSTTGTASETIPRTANLLPCKQWWRVCFLYGDQEKYYRQVYGRAASERIAASKNSKTKSLIDAGINLKPSALATTAATANSLTLFPLKQPSRRRSKHQQQLQETEHVKKSSTSEQEQQLQRCENVKPNRKITVLDDPFLFGVNEHANLSEDSGIDNAAFEHNSIQTKPKPKIDRILAEACINRDLCNDLKINESDLKLLHMSRRNRSGLVIPLESYLNESISFMSEAEDLNASNREYHNNECGGAQDGQLINVDLSKQSPNIE